MDTTYEIIKAPLTEKDCDKDGRVRGVIEMDLEGMIDNTLEDVLDLMSEILVGNSLLQDITFKIVGFKGPTMLHIEVSGNPVLAFEK